MTIRVNKLLALKIFILSTILLVLSVIIFVSFIIFTAPLEKLERVVNSKDQKGLHAKSVLDEGSLVSRSEIKTFLLFSESIPNPERWIEEKLKDETFIINNPKEKDLLFINRQVDLPGLIQNDCPVIYCFQQRLAFEEIPSVFWKGLIGIEDFRYLEHRGIDFKSIARAIITDIKKMKLEQGGSTLTQQLIKNLFYTNEKKFRRKIKEIILSVYVESIYEKENILEAYLNEVEWGSFQGIKIKGIYSASIFYFSKHPSMLSEYEASMLIGLLKGPYYYHPIRKTTRLKSRVKIVFNKLKEIGSISTKAKPWDEKKWERWLKELKERNKTRPYYAVWRTYKNNSPYLEDFEKFHFIFETNKVLADAIEKVKEEKLDLDLSIKAIFADIKQGEGKFFSYYSKYERSKKRGIHDEFHQVGSTLKPILYQIFLNNGYKMSDMVETKPIPMKLVSGNWSPREAHKIKEKEVTLSEALMKSYNRPVIRLSQLVGFEKIEKELIEYIPKLKTPLDQYPAQLLGAVELSMKELFEAYEDLVNKSCLKEDVEESVIEVMSDPTLTTIRFRVAKELSRLKFFGKTGTSNNGLDNWFVSFDGSELGVIWVGHEGDRKNKKLPFYGSNTSFRVFNAFNRTRGKRFNDLACRTLERPALEGP